MGKHDFSRGDAWNTGWTLAKQNWLFFLKALIVSGIVLAIPIGLAAAIGSSAVALVLMLVGYVAEFGIIMGLMRICLKLVDGQRAELSDLFGEFSRLPRFLGASIMVMIPIYLGTMLLIIPGLIFAMRYMFYGFAFIDKGYGARQAISASTALTQGAKMKLFVTMIILSAINAVASIPFGLGLFITGPATLLTIAQIYRTLDRQTRPVVESAVSEARPQFA